MTRIFQTMFSEEMWMFSTLALTFLALMILSHLAIKYKKTFAYKTGLFFFKRRINFPAYKRVDFSQYGEKLNGKEISLIQFEEDNQIFLKVEKDRTKRKRSNHVLHGVLEYDRQTGDYVLKMKVLMAHMLSPLFGLLVVYIFAFRINDFLSSNLIVAAAIVGITIFNIGQLIYMANKEFKLAAELIEKLLIKKTSNDTSRTTGNF